MDFSLKSKESKKPEWKEYQGPDRVISSHEFILDHDAKDEPSFKVKSHIPSLDMALEGGFEGGELYGISGLTKHGKTTLAQTFTWNALKDQRHSLWFTFEVTPFKFLQKFPEVPTIYLPRELKVSAMEWLGNKIQESYEKFHTKIVFIDHLHYLFDLAQARNTSLEIGRVIRTLKKIAVDRDMVVFILCHTGKVDPEGEIGYSAIRDSSFVAQESDSVFMIQRTSDRPKGASLYVEFHRRTGVMRQKINLQLVNGIFQEVDEGRE